MLHALSLSELQVAGRKDVNRVWSLNSCNNNSASSSIPRARPGLTDPQIVWALFLVFRNETRRDKERMQNNLANNALWRTDFLRFEAYWQIVLRNNSASFLSLPFFLCVLCSWCIACDKSHSLVHFGGSHKGGFQKGVFFGRCSPIPKFPPKVFPCNATLAEENYGFHIPGPQFLRSRNEGTIAKTALL